MIEVVAGMLVRRCEMSYLDGFARGNGMTRDGDFKVNCKRTHVSEEKEACLAFSFRRLDVLDNGRGCGRREVKDQQHVTGV